MPTRKRQLISVNFKDLPGIEFEISSSAQDRIKRELSQAVAKKTIADGRERSIANRALLAAAIEMAHKEGTKVVMVAHVMRGWRESLSIKGPGCDPPSLCIHRTVIERVDEIKKQSQVFRELMSEIE